MKKLLLYGLIGIGSPCLASQTYYIDSQLGKDSWSGKYADPISWECSTGTCTDGPWKNAYKIYLSSLTLTGGDSVLLRRGRVWKETIWEYASGTPGNPLQFGAYGAGDKPALYPPSPIADRAWSLVSGSIWRAPLATPPVGDIWVGDVPQTWSREPDSGFFTIKSTGPSASQFVDPDLTGSETEIVGSTIKIKNVAWTLQTHRVTAYDPAAHRVTLESIPTPYAMKPGSGYVMMGKRHLIDQPGEWAWESGYLYVWPHDGKMPTFGGRSVGVPSNYGIVLSRVHDVAVRDIEVRGSSISVAVAYSTAIVLSGLDLYGSSNFGVNLYKVNDAMVEKCVLSQTLRDGITVAHSTHVAIMNNTIEDTGLDLRQTTLAGIQAGVSTDILIANNIVRRSGYAGISTTADDTRVLNNIVESSCLVLDDCAAIYTHNKSKNPRFKGIDIIGNIVDETANPYSSGIYLDDDSDFVRVKNNTVLNSSNWGIYLHNGHDNELSNNTIFNSRNDGIHIVSDNALKETRDNTVVDNVVFVSSTAASNVERITTTTDTNFGISDRNLFGTLFSTRVVTQITTAWGSSHNPKTYSLSSWRDASGLDLNSKESGEFYSFAVQIDSTTDRIANGSFNTSMSGWGHWSAAGTQTVGLKSAGDCAHDGGCLSVAFSSSPTAVLTLSHRIRIVKGSEYRVRGDLKSALAGPISIVIRDQGVLTDIHRQTVALPVGDWGNFDFTFIADRTDPGALFYLESKGNASNYLIDNVSVRALSPIKNNGADAAMIVVNKEPTARLFSLDTVYIDTNTLVKSGSTYLQPNSSQILLPVLNNKDNVCNNRETEFTAPMDCASGQTGPGVGSVIDTTPPTVPGSLTSVGKRKALDFSWTASVDEGGSGLDRYFIDVSTSALFNPNLSEWNQRDMGLALAGSISGLEDNTTYYVRLRAKDLAGNLSNYAVSNAKTLGDLEPPTIAMIAPVAGATYLSATSVLVAADAFDNEGVTKVLFARNGVVVSTDTTAPYEYHWPITAEDNGPHSWSAIAFDAMNNSSSTVGVSVTVAIDVTKPSVVLTSPVSGTAFNAPQVVTVTASAFDDGGIAKVCFSLDGLTVSTDTTAPYESAWPITFANNGTYTWSATAFDAMANSASAVPVSVTVDIDGTPPSVPEDLSLSDVSASAIRLSWTPSFDHVGVAGYHLLRGSVTIATISGDLSSYSDTGLSPQTAYSYALSAFDAAGNESDLSPAITGTTQRLPLAQPIGALAAVGTQSVELRWDPVDGATRYTLAASLLREPEEFSLQSESVGSEGSLSGLTPNTTYFFFGKACDEDRCSDFAFFGSAVTQANVPGLSIVHVIGIDVQLSIDPKGNPDGTIYRLEARPREGDYTLKNLGSNLSPTIRGLTPGEKYTFRVFAQNRAGVTTAPSSEQNATLAPASLDGARAYPSPFRPGLGASGITFDQLPEDSSIGIFTVNGQRIKTLTTASDGSIFWDLTNDNGSSIASGVYLALIDKNGNRKQLKVLVQN